jgi:hypothetical protein
VTVRQNLSVLGVAVLLSACGSGGSVSALPTVSVSPASPLSKPLDSVWPGAEAALASYVWSDGPKLPLAVSEIGVAALGEQIHVLGGYIQGKPHHAVHVMFDVSTGKWSTLADLPDQLDHVGTTTVGGMLYAMGGYNPKGVTDAVYRFDPGTGRWTTLAPMPTPRAAAVAVVLDGKIHLIGGRDSHGDINRHDVFDPATDTWTTAAPIPRPTDHTAYAVVDGKIHVAGGRPGENTEHDVYDPSTDKWSTAAPLPAPRNSFAGADFGGRFVVLGGENSTETKVFGDVWAWDPATNAWSPLPKLLQAVQGIGAAVVDGKLYVPAGGPVGGASLETDRLQILGP